ncbi:hypothetical protein Plhal304r1_c049g0131911 [Plasmopara halstedii]
MAFDNFLFDGEVIKKLVMRVFFFYSLFFLSVVKLSHELTLSVDANRLNDSGHFGTDLIARSTDVAANESAIDASLSDYDGENPNTSVDKINEERVFTSEQINRIKQALADASAMEDTLDKIGTVIQRATGSNSREASINVLNQLQNFQEVERERYMSGYIPVFVVTVLQNYDDFNGIENLERIVYVEENGNKILDPTITDLWLQILHEMYKDHPDVDKRWVLLREAYRHLSRYVDVSNLLQGREMNDFNAALRLHVCRVQQLDKRLELNEDFESSLFKLKIKGDRNVELDWLEYLQILASRDNEIYPSLLKYYQGKIQPLDKCEKHVNDLPDVPELAILKEEMIKLITAAKESGTSGTHN